jgi:hypothetical protein
MKLAFHALALALAVCSAGTCQPAASPKLEFDVAAGTADPTAEQFGGLAYHYDKKQTESSDKAKQAGAAASWPVKASIFIVDHVDKVPAPK